MIAEDVVEDGVNVTVQDEAEPDPETLDSVHGDPENEPAPPEEPNDTVPVGLLGLEAVSVTVAVQLAAAFRPIGFRAHEIAVDVGSGYAITTSAAAELVVTPVTAVASTATKLDPPPPPAAGPPPAPPPPP